MYHTTSYNSLPDVTDPSVEASARRAARPDASTRVPRNIFFVRSQASRIGDGAFGLAGVRSMHTERHLGPLACVEEIEEGVGLACFVAIPLRGAPSRRLWLVTPVLSVWA